MSATRNVQTMVQRTTVTSETTLKTRILVVDDHAIVRLGMKQLISAQPDLSICCEAETGEEALALALKAKPDLAIVDLSLGTMHGLELVRQLHQALPDMPVLVLSMHDEALFAERAVRAGARGYMTKKGAIDGLIQAVRHVLAGKIYASEAVSQQALAGLQRGKPVPEGRIGGLTDREIQVFELIGRGLSTAGIADRLRVSVKTIETYRSNIKTKLNLRDAAALVRYATSWIDRL
jgi:DNA-binding NarL/FixJ family response regulator